MRKWSEIIADPNFQQEPTEVRQATAQKYYQNLLQDPNFAKESQEVQNQTRTRLFNTAAPEIVQNERLEQFDKMYYGLPDYSIDLSDPMISSEFKIIEPERRKAYEQLIDSGLDKQQIEAFLSAKKALRPSMLKEQGGQIIGSIIGGTAIPALVNFIPGLAVAPEEAITVPLGAKIGQYMAGVVGSAVGGGAGKLVHQVVDPYQDASLKDMLLAAGQEGLWEAATRGIVGGVKAGYRGLFKKKPIAEAQEAMRFFAEEAGGIFPPSATDKRLLTNILEGTSRDTYGGQQIWKAFDDANAVKYEALGRKIVDSIGGEIVDSDPTEAGRLLFKQISRSGMRVHGALGIAERAGKGRLLREFDDIVQPLYRKFDEATKAAGIPTTSIKQWALERLAEDKRLKILPAGIRREIRNLQDLPETLTSLEVIKKRSATLALQRELEAGQKAGIKELSEVNKQFNKLLFEAENIPTLTPQNRMLLHNANKIYAAGMDMLDSPDFSFKLARKIADDPQRARELLFPKTGKAGSGALQRIRALKEGLTNETGPYLKLKAGLPGGKLVKSQEGTAAWDALRKSWLAAEIDSGTLSRTLKKMGPETLNEMFSPEELRGIRLYEDIGGYIKPKAHLGGGSLAVRSAQIRQVAGSGLLLYGGLGSAKSNRGLDDFVALGAGGVILFGPYTYARLATKGKVGQSIIKEIARHNVNPSKGMAGPIAVKATRLLVAWNNEEKDKIMRERKMKARRAAERPHLSYVEKYGFR